MSCPATHLLVTYPSLLSYIQTRTHVEFIDVQLSCRIWEAETGNEKARLEGHSDDVLSVTISLDGKTIISGSMDKTIR